MAASAGMTIFNEVVIWSPTILGYKEHPPQSCPGNFSEYKFLAVGENTTVKGKGVCVLYTPIGLMWSIPQYFTGCGKLVLNASVVDGELTYKFLCQ